MMKKTFRVISVVISLCLALGLLTGCGSNADNSSKDVQNTKTAENKTEAKAKTITWLTVRNADQPVARSVQTVVDEYKKTNPNFEFSMQGVADRASYLQKLRTLVASKELPDWFDIDADAYCSQLIDQGLMVNMEKELKDMGKYDSFYPIALKYQTFEDGRMYMFPLEYNIEMFWYNKKIFSENNISIPQTFGEFIKVCETLKSKDITPVAVAGKEKWPMLRYLAFLPFRATGNEFIEKVKKGEASFTDPVGMEAINLIADMGTKGYFQSGFATTDYTTGKDVFFGGKAAMLYIGTWELNSFLPQNLSETMKDNVDYFKLPMTEGAKTKANDYWAHSGIGTAISVQSYDETTKDFLKFLIEKYPEIYASKELQFPPMKYEATGNDVPELYKKVAKDMSEVGEWAMCWDVRLDPVTNELIGNEVTALAIGALSPEDFAKKMDKSVKENAPKFFK